MIMLEESQIRDEIAVYTSTNPLKLSGHVVIINRPPVTSPGLSRLFRVSGKRPVFETDRYVILVTSPVAVLAMNHSLRKWIVHRVRRWLKDDASGVEIDFGHWHGVRNVLDKVDMWGGDVSSMHDAAFALELDKLDGELKRSLFSAAKKTQWYQDLFNHIGEYDASND